MKNSKIMVLSAIAVAMLGTASFANDPVPEDPPCPGKSCEDRGGPQGNNGWGNGDDTAPGNSEDRGAENEGAPEDNTSDAPGNSTN
jgi:hypothetical protein